MRTIAFDVYGTLINTDGVVRLLSTMVGDKALLFSKRWRDKQLEYSFRRSQMGLYSDFSVCTKEALNFVSSEFSSDLTLQQQAELLALYQALPAFEEGDKALRSLSNFRLFAFSNGSHAAVKKLLTHAGLAEYFQSIISVESTKRFKPDPVVYKHFNNETQSKPDSTWLISSNPFDILGAHNVGWKTAWVNRNGAIFDPWGIEPSVTINDLTELAQTIQ